MIPTHVLENSFLRLETMTTSPRILRLFPAGHGNIFADLGGDSLHTHFGDFYFRGGHRFWHSPESLPRTYMPDNDGATLSLIPGGVRIDQPAEPWTGISKSLEISLNPHRPQVILRHELHNDGAWPVELAPWGVTMFRQGGVGIFPQPQGPSDPAGLLPNRHLAVWSYTRINDPRLTLRDDFILVKAAPAQPAIKIGYFNPHGWQAYYLEGTLFVKRFEALSGARYPDGGCNTETYCNDKFFELESLAPLAHLEPGSTAVHHETWELYNGLDQSIVPVEIAELISQ